MLKFWPVQQHGWSAQPPEAFFIELNSVSSVELVGRFEFQIVYEGRRRLMHLRAPSPELAVSWVESLRRAAPLWLTGREAGAGAAPLLHSGRLPPEERRGERSAGRDMADRYDRELDRYHDDIEEKRDGRRERHLQRRLKAEREMAREAEHERKEEEARAWEVIEERMLKAEQEREQAEEQVRLFKATNILAPFFAAFYSALASSFLTDCG